MRILVKEFIKKESSAGIILIFITFLALSLRNSPLSEYYTLILYTNVEVYVGELLSLEKPLVLWINDGLMALFFLLIGLEIKRELLAGHLSSFSKIALPGFAALGGMLVPALIFIAFNHGDEFAMRGWAIPTATDIAFALGILSLLGGRIPASLKVFLMALAIIDDIGAIIIISVFYTTELSYISMLLALGCFVILLIMNKLNVVRITAYIIIGIILWISVLKSGVHATLAGIILAFTIPLNVKREHEKHISPSRILEKNLHFWVAYFVLPIFAFMNAGVDLKSISVQDFVNPVSLGVILGLFLGKQIGVMLCVFIAVRLHWAQLPKCVTWMQMYGVAVLTGIGFTMSLFVDSLAYYDSNAFMHTDKLSILIGSLLSGVVGFVILRIAKKRKACNI
ncbi:Na+/H+ antiporter NhaA [Candidatus Marinarcus aquaticus]|uniref:Na(+)/H(+) antiporter NhaA n=1 Tax=Candidatus Marinarcus aquaticus TaxID=2044504 RepID=A0A4Q0XRR7_9BACT|nr:Na+/H+ antiporter NhaA [Candidatus Marinarcus aquaticus]RXJ56398.1 Na+/H+ antiporter NhaA [Candidatus Marinarcus aquaticus]